MVGEEGLVTVAGHEVDEVVGEEFGAVLVFDVGHPLAVLTEDGFAVADAFIFREGLVAEDIGAEEELVEGALFGAFAGGAVLGGLDVVAEERPFAGDAGFVAGALAQGAEGFS